MTQSLLLSLSFTSAAVVNVCVRTYPPYVMPILANPVPSLDVIRNMSISNANITGIHAYRG